MASREEVLDELLKDDKTPEDLLGKNGIVKQLTKALIERALQAELTDHLGYRQTRFSRPGFGQCTQWHQRQNAQDRPRRSAPGHPS